MQYFETYFLSPIKDALDFRLDFEDKLHSPFHIAQIHLEVVLFLQIVSKDQDRYQHLHSKCIIYIRYGTDVLLWFNIHLVTIFLVTN